MTWNSFFENLLCRFQDDDIPALSAQLTYYLILAFFPFLIFVAALLSFTQFSANDALEKLSMILPELSNRTIADVFHEIENTRSGSLLSFGLIASLWSAANGVSAIVKGMNKAYDEEEKRSYWSILLISVLTTFMLAIGILVSFVMLVFGRKIGEWLYRAAHLPGDFSVLWSSVQYIIPLALLWTMFVLIYVHLPSLRLQYKQVMPGALFATIGWIAASLLFSSYVNHFDSFTRTYGSIGGMIVLLIWLYLSSMIILLGGEINATLYFHRTGKKKPPCKSFSFKLSWPFSKRQKTTL